MSYSDKISQVEVNMEYRQENTIFDKSEICEVLWINQNYSAYAKNIL